MSSALTMPSCPQLLWVQSHLSVQPPWSPPLSPRPGHLEQGGRWTKQSRLLGCQGHVAVVKKMGLAVSSRELGRRRVSVAAGAEATSLHLKSHGCDEGAVTLAPKEAGKGKGPNLQGRRESWLVGEASKEVGMTTSPQEQVERGPSNARCPHLPDHVFCGPDISGPRSLPPTCVLSCFCCV